jgi:hypothetical protein
MNDEEMEDLRRKVMDFVNEARLDRNEDYNAVTSTKYQSLVMLEEIVLSAIMSAQKQSSIRKIANQPTLIN